MEKDIRDKEEEDETNKPKKSRMSKFSLKLRGMLDCCRE